MLAASMFPLLLAISASAAPGASKAKRAGCDISKAKISFPAGQTALVEPTIEPSFIAIAIGTQNYTCGSTGTYTNVGAVAELFDISCLYGTGIYDDLQDIAINIWEASPPSVTPQEIIAVLHNAHTPEILGQHYYVVNPLTGSGVNPKWDFTSSGANAGNPDAFVVAAKVAGLAAPKTATDIDWVSLQQIQGDLADQVFRVDTRSGQPPTSCAPGSNEITVKYAAKYWLFGGSVKK